MLDPHTTVPERLTPRRGSAEDLKHRRKVAIKVLKPELAAVMGAERFLAEIETTADLQHPHILPLFDSGEVDSFLLCVMPWVEGELAAGARFLVVGFGSPGRAVPFLGRATMIENKRSAGRLKDLADVEALEGVSGRDLSG